MIVVVEGPDGAGKTTLVNEIYQEAESQLLNPLRVHHGDVSDPLSSYLEVIEQGQRLNRFVLADRLHYGELVYGFTRRDKPAFTLDELDYMNKKIHHGIGITVVLAPPLERLISNHQVRGECTPRELAREREMFIYLAKLTQLSHPTGVVLLTGDTTLDHLNVMAKLIVDDMKMKRERARWS